jgi:hypothetical protein
VSTNQNPSEAYDFGSYAGVHIPVGQSAENQLGQRSSGQESDDLVQRVHRRALDHLRLDELCKLPEDRQRREIRSIAERLIDEENLPLSGAQRAQFIQDLLDEILGLWGPSKNSCAIPARPTSW